LGSNLNGQNIKLELVNVKSVIQIKIEHPYTNSFDDLLFATKDTIFYLKNSKERSEISIYKLTITNTLIGYSELFDENRLKENPLIKIDFDSVSSAQQIKKEEEEKQKAELKEQKAELQKQHEERKGEIEAEFYYKAIGLINQYKKLIDNKSLSKIADILNEEGFSRDYFTSSNGNFVTKYTVVWTYDKNAYDTRNNIGDWDSSNNYLNDKITIVIKTWYSYGYGKSYYDIEATIKYTVDKETYYKQI
jgi:hypothetical protein